mmetsp:Transcript_158351/g.507874  ORF Transcript_158351/g.507874 Transcript_158351/m.507874 type:complete len:235 (-) Transcript_158351:56-760(-)
MWFAALGSYQHNDWFIHLLYKVLEGSEPVLSLLDVEESPWPRGSKPPKAVRAWLYHYDFTRLDTPWAHTIPGTQVLNLSRAEDVGLWWTRKKVEPYVPAVTVKELKDVIKGQGWPLGEERLAAVRRVRNCTSAERHSPWLGRCCAAVVATRDALAPLERTVGWKIRTGVFQSVWSGASDYMFVDVHFAVIVGSLLALVTLRAALSAASRLCCRASRRAAVPHGRGAEAGKVKKE